MPRRDHEPVRLLHGVAVISAGSALLGALLATGRASAALPPETDLPAVTDGAWTVAGAQIEARDRALYSGDEVLPGLIERPVADAAGRWLAAAVELEGSVSLLWITGGPRRVLATHSALDRIAVAPDGSGVVFAAPNPQGVSALWYVDVDTGVETQLTNPASPQWVPGSGPPSGFVAMPVREPPRIDGDRVTWEAPDGPHEATLPPAIR